MLVAAPAVLGLTNWKSVIVSPELMMIGGISAPGNFDPIVSNINRIKEVVRSS